MRGEVYAAIFTGLFSFGTYMTTSRFNALDYQIGSLARQIDRLDQKLKENIDVINEQKDFVSEKK